MTAPPTRATERLGLVLSAGFAALEGYDLACYGVTVPSLLADRGFGADKAAAGTVGALVAIGMLLGAAVCAATSSAIPRSATSSIASSVRRLNVAPSPVLCTSIRVPVSVATTFASTSARESSE